MRPQPKSTSFLQHTWIFVSVYPVSLRHIKYSICVIRVLQNSPHKNWHIVLYLYLYPVSVVQKKWKTTMKVRFQINWMCFVIESLIVIVLHWLEWTRKLKISEQNIHTTTTRTTTTCKCKFKVLIQMKQTKQKYSEFKNSILSQ